MAEQPVGEHDELQKFEIDPALADQRPNAIVHEAAKSTFEEIEKMAVIHRVGLFTKLLILGHGRSLKAFLKEIMERIRVEKDRTTYEIRVSPSPVPNASILSSGKMTVNLGLLHGSENVDELAFVMAHEATHANPGYMRALTDDPAFQEFLDSLSGYKGLNQSQREEIRADIGATERLILGKYNPWAGYNYHRRVARKFSDSWDTRIFRRTFKHSFEYLSTHPVAEVRMSAIKGWIVKRSKEIDLVENTQEFTSFSATINMLRFRIGIVLTPLISMWFHRAVLGFFAYSAVDQLAMAIFGASITDLAVSQIMNQVAGENSDSIGAIILYYINATKEGFNGGLSWTLNIISDHIGWANLYAITGTLGLKKIYNRVTGSNEFHSLKEYKIQLQKHNRTYEQMIATNSESNPNLPVQLLSFISEDMAGLIELFDTSLIRVRDLSGLSWALTGYFNMTQQLLDEINQNFAECDRQRLDIAFDKIPAAAYEYEPIYKSLLRFVSIDGWNLKPVRQKDESSWQYRLRLQWLSRQTISESDLLSLISNLFLVEQRDTAFNLLERNLNRVTDYVLFPNRANAEEAKTFKRLLTRLKIETMGTYKRKYRGGKLNWAIIIDNLYQLIMNPADRVAHHTLFNQVPVGLSITMSARLWLEEKNERFLKDYLQKFKSLQQLVSFLINDLKPRNVDMETLAPMLVDIILEHPEWFETREDVDLLLDQDILWPKMNWNSHFSTLERLFDESFRKLQKQFPNVWKFEPGSAEKYHDLILRVLRTKGFLPQNFDEKFDLWQKLTSRGVTSTTDRLFEEIYTLADEDKGQKQKLVDVALLEGRIWEPERKIELVRDELKSSRIYKALLFSEKPNFRKRLLDKILKYLEKRLPERGRCFAELIEEISIEINSTDIESRQLHEAKIVSAGGEKQEDFGLRVFSGLLEAGLKWELVDQWNLILFLRGEGAPSATIKKGFRTIGVFRIKRMFEVLPVEARTGLIESFLDSPSGLLAKVDVRKGWSKTIIDHLMRNFAENEARIARELLEGFLHALEATNNNGLQSIVLGYLLATPPNQQTSIGEILKQILEIFGATGIKIGQFIATSGLLPAKETEILRKLQERANVPMRETQYADLRSIYGFKIGDNLPFKLKHLLGAASLKYAILASDGATRADIVLKIVRLEALAHTRMEFLLLTEMVKFLTKKYGTKYSVFASIVNASKRAVERELIVSDEVKRSRLARETIYAQASDHIFEVAVPREILAKDRLIVAEYARGVGFFTLSDELKKLLAEKILKMERDILFGEQDLIKFDPDRHAGNYRIHINKTNGDGLLTIKSIELSPIDFGQLLEITNKERQHVIDMFALSQIAKEVGSVHWIANQLQQMHSLDDKTTSQLTNALKKVFPDRALQSETAYFALLSALEFAGFEVDIKYFDFFRGIIQLNQYQKFVSGEPRNWRTPSEELESRVREKIDSYRAQLKLSFLETIRWAWNNRKEAIQTFFRSLFLRRSSQPLGLTVLDPSPPIAGVESSGFSEEKTIGKDCSGILK
ncbi:MAG: M48 family metalloprotease [Bdellovibrionales bacterium]|nr:M48 family metalloprotease [Bdellovibrionales bacterium]